jgi:hypothetical protein
MTTNKVYMAPGTPIIFTGSGGDAVITTNNLALRRWACLCSV